MTAALNSALSDAIARHGGDAAILVPALIDRVAVRDGAIVVLAPSGEPDLTWRAGRPIPTTVDELVGRFRDNPSCAPAFAGSASAPTKSSAPRITTMSANDWLNKTSLATPEQRTALFREAAAGKFKITS